jgi:hypothetical protein
MAVQDARVAAEAASFARTASGAWSRAALAWHWGKFVFTDDPVQQRAAQDRAVACFRKATPTLTPPVPAHHAGRLAEEAPGAELVIYPQGSHGVTNFAYESRSHMADLLAAHLLAAHLEER